MTNTSARDGLVRFGAARASRSGLLIRALLGAPNPDDDRLRAHLIEDLVGRVGPDGSDNGRLLETAVLAARLLDLGHQFGPRDRTITWLLTRQEQPGGFHGGCTAARHRQRLCEHFLGGFFSPMPVSHRAAPLTLPNGQTFRRESHARFVVSLVALEAVLRAGRAHEPLIERHLESCAALAADWQAWQEHLPRETGFLMLSALAAAPDRWRPLCDQIIEWVDREQGDDGTWPRADIFSTLDCLSRVPLDRALPALRRAVSSLKQRQHEDGSFGSVAAEERGLIAARVLVRTDAA